MGCKMVNKLPRGKVARKCLLSGIQDDSKNPKASAERRDALLSVHGSPLGVYKKQEDSINVEAIHESEEG